MKKAYLDTNVLVYKLLPGSKSALQDRAEQIFYKCRSGTHLGIISSLTLTEFAGVCQKIETYDTAAMKSMNDSKREQHVRMEGLNNYKRVIPHLLSLPHIKLEKAINLKFQDIISDAITVMQETNGTITIPKSQYGQPSHAKFKRAYTADILHVLLAKHVGCDEFYTFDAGIKKTKRSFKNQSDEDHEILIFIMPALLGILKIFI